MDARRSGGEALIQGLIQYGVDTVFCVPGESYLAALDALYDRKEQIRTITCRQEGGVAYMAEAYGKLTGHPGVCFVSRDLALPTPWSASIPHSRTLLPY